jgi:hypothetical protein
VTRFRVPSPLRNFAKLGRSLVSKNPWLIGQLKESLTQRAGACYTERPYELHPATSRPAFQFLVLRGPFRRCSYAVLLCLFAWPACVKYDLKLMKGVPMKMSHGWKSNARKKKTKPTYKIRWEALGLSRPDRTQASIEDIRSEVSMLATQGLSERTQMPSARPTVRTPGHKRK